ncbi:MAG: hypothetical protein KKF89_05195, partial [Nanoarchaeota archaeon]|nr:hypothetical protein [Nanoarchaeota archaeon]
IQGNVLFYIIKGLGRVSIPSHNYDQILEGGAKTILDEKIIKNAVSKGSSEIIINSTVQALPGIWGVGNYLSFSLITEEIVGRTDYENYGKFYSITNSEFLGTRGHKISFTPSLEKNINAGDKAYLVDKDHYYKWFGQQVKFDYSATEDNTYRLIFGLDDGLNIGSSNEFLVFFDNAAPIATSVTPMGGTIPNNKPVSITFKEHKAGSGLKRDSMRLEIYKNNIFFGTKTKDNGLNLTYLGENAGFKEYKIEYIPENGWGDGHYNVTVNIEDQAGNKLNSNEFYNETIIFVIDGRTPTLSTFNVEGSTEENIDTHGRTVVDNEQPIFYLDFTKNNDGSEELLDIEIISTKLLNDESNVDCSLINKNLFSCSFDTTLEEGLHALTVSASKILPNGSFGPMGNYMTDKEGKALTIIIDKTIPSFSLEAERKYIRPNQALTITADVNNEDYDLYAKISIVGEEISLETQKINNKYYFIIPETFDWGNEGLKPIEVTLKDYANHQSTEYTSVIIDDTPPDINIIAIVGNKSFLTSDNNATVGEREITIIGEVASDTISLCYEQLGGETGCINKCLGEEKECIKDNAEDYSRFELTLIVNGTNAAETLNQVSIILTDISGHETTSSLYILLDLEPPSVPEITFE